MALKQYRLNRILDFYRQLLLQCNTLKAQLNADPDNRGLASALAVAEQITQQYKEDFDISDEDLHHV